MEKNRSTKYLKYIYTCHIHQSILSIYGRASIRAVMKAPLRIHNNSPKRETINVEVVVLQTLVIA